MVKNSICDTIINTHSDGCAIFDTKRHASVSLVTHKLCVTQKNQNIYLFLRISVQRINETFLLLQLKFVKQKNWRRKIYKNIVLEYEKELRVKNDG